MFQVFLIKFKSVFFIRSLRQPIYYYKQNETIQDFFYLGEKYNKEDKNFLELFANLSAENKAVIIDLMKKLK